MKRLHNRFGSNSNTVRQDLKRSNAARRTPSAVQAYMIEIMEPRLLLTTSTTTVVTSNTATDIYGQPVIFTATVTPASGSGETGSVQFQIDGSNAGSPVNLSGNTAAYSTSSLVAGVHTIKATYSGDSNFSGSVNGNYSLNVLASLVPYTNGALPENSLAEDANGDLFGTAANGGEYSDGTVFEIAAGSGVVKTVASFNGANGQQPHSNVVLDSSGDLYSTTYKGGASNVGTVFEIAAGSTTITTLATFNVSNGSYPVAGLTIDSAGNLFGTTIQGGSSGFGTVFEIPKATGVLTTLGSFNGTNGQQPDGGVTLDSTGDIFGASYRGGANGDGAVYEIVHGTGVITPLASLNGTNGEYPDGNLALDSAGDLFGTTQLGGSDYAGAAFEVVTGSGAITLLASFTDGGNPAGNVVLDSSGNLFGTTQAGGDSSDGIVFEIAHGSAAVSTLATFTGDNGEYPNGLTVDSAGNLFGTCEAGNGSTAGGTVFELAHGSSSVATLATFVASGGQYPESNEVVDTAGNIFGTTYAGGAYGDGVIYEISRGSSVVTTVATFTGTNGAQPEGNLVLDSSGNLFGATYSGGSSNDGTVFELPHGSGSITTLATFTGTNGTNPQGGVAIDSSGDLFGATALGGGSGNEGVVYEIPHGTTSLTTLALFPQTNNASVGYSPVGGVAVDAAGNLFGTTKFGGTSNYGTVFEIAHGSGAVTTLAGFDGATASNPIGAVAVDSNDDVFGTAPSNTGQTDGGIAFEVVYGSGTLTTLTKFVGGNGYQPKGDIALDSSGDLFGTTYQGGTSYSSNSSRGYGTAYEIVSGSGTVTTLASFTGANGYYPTGGVSLDSAGNIFATAYSGGANSSGTSFELSEGLAQSVSKAPTTTAVSSSNNTSSFGQTVTFTATITPVSGTTETGTVQFQVDGANVGSPVSVAGNTASYSTAALTTGNHSVAAIYSGDSNFNSSTSSVVAENIAPPPLLVFTTAPTNAIAGAAINQPGGIQISVENSSGAVISTNDTITLSLGTDPSGASLTGTLSAAAVNGVATFTNVSITSVGSGYTLVAADNTSSSVTSATSSAFSISAAAAAKLIFSNGPQTTVAGSPIDSPAGIQVKVEDAYSNPAGGSDQITLSLYQGPSGVSLTPITVTAVNGIATFTNVVLTTASQLYKLHAVDATTGSVSAITSTLFYVVAGPASQLVFTAQPANSIAGATLDSPAGVQVLLEDTYGNLTTSTDYVSISPSGASGLTGTDGVRAVNGTASFTNLAVNTAANADTLIASDETNSSVSQATSTPFTVSPAAAAQLVFTNQPATTSAGSVLGSPTGVQLVLQDAYGNQTTVSDTVTVSLGSNETGATLGGATTVSASNGVVTFTGLLVTTAGSGYTLLVRDSTIHPVVSAVSTAFNITALSATKLAFSNPPVATVAGAVIDAPTGVQVAIEDQYGNIVSGTDSIQLGLGNHPGGVSLAGTLTAAAVNGVASFTNLSLNTASPGYTLVATDQTTAAITSATSPVFAITAAAPVKLTAVNQPANSIAGLTIGSSDGPVTFDLLDSAGNLSNSPDVIQLSLGTNPTGAVLGGTVTATVVNGVATFGRISIAKAGTGYTLVATDQTTSGVTTATTSPFNISPSFPSQVVFSAGAVNATAGASIAPSGGIVVLVEDSNGNPTGTDNITLSLGTNPTGASLAGTLTVAAVAGIATFNNISMTTASAGYTLVATDAAPGVSSATSAAFTVAPGPAVKLQFRDAIQTTTAGAVLNAPSGVEVDLLDAYGNLAAGSDSVQIAIDNNPGSASLSGTTANLNIAAGKVTFSNLSITTAAVGYTLKATDSTNSAVNSADSSRFGIFAATPSTLSFYLQPASTTAGIVLDNPNGLQVFAKDQYGNLASGDLINIAVAGGSASLHGSTTVTANGGTATFFVLINQPGTGYTLVATDTTTPNVSAATSMPFDITIGPPAQVVFQTLPASTTAGAALGPSGGLQVELLDAGGNLTSVSDKVALSFGQNAGNATLTGTTTVTAVDGIATLLNVAIPQAGVGYTLVATDTTVAVASAATSPFNISAGPAAKLGFTTAPISASAGQTINPAGGVQVTIEDAYGNPVGGTDTIAIAIANNTGGAQLLGSPQSVAASNGVAIFTGLSIKTAAVYTLVATDLSLGSISNGSSSTFTISPGPTTQLGFVFPPVNIIAGQEVGGPGGIKVGLEDQYGNLTETGTDTITLSLASNTESAALQGTTTVAAAYGVANFDAASIQNAGNGYQLIATDMSGSLASVISTAFNVSAAAPAVIKFIVAPVNANAGATLPSITVEIFDAFLNPTYGSDVLTVSLAPGASGGGTLSGTKTATANNGVATFSGLSIDKAGAYALLVADQTYTSVSGTSTLFYINGGTGYGFGAAASFPAGSAGGPVGNIVSVNGNLFGTTSGQAPSSPGSGSTNNGTIWEMAAGSRTITTIASFASTGSNGINTTGSYPTGTIVLDPSGNIYGTTRAGGAYADGVVYEIPAANRSTITVLYSFNTTAGIEPVGGLAIYEPAGNPNSWTIFGTTEFGGSTYNNPALSNGYGTLFDFTATSSVSVVLNFQPDSAGNTPVGPLAIDSSGDIFSTYYGGVYEVPVGYSTSRQVGSSSSFDSGANGVTIGPGGELYGVTSDVYLETTYNPGTVYELSAAGSNQTATTLATFTGLNGDNPAGGLIYDPSTGELYGSTENGGPAYTSFGTGDGTFFEINASGSPTLTTLGDFTGGNGAFPQTPVTLLNPSGPTILGTAESGGANSVGAVFEYSPATSLAISSSTPLTVPASASPISSPAPSVQVLDAYGNIATSDNSLITLTASPSAGISGTLTASDSNGIATFSNIIATGVGSYVITASDGSLQSATWNLTVTHANTGQLSLTAQPPTSISAGSPFSVAYQLTDTFGDPIPDVSVSLTLSYGTLLGTTTLSTNSSGGVLFSGLSVDQIGGNYVLTAKATGSGYTAATSNPFTVTVGAPAQLIFTSQTPVDAAAGSVLNPNTGITVVIEDQYGNRTTSTDSITITLGNGGGAVLNGTVTQTADSGIAAFGDLSISTAGTGYTLVATDSSSPTTVSAATTSPFQVTPAPASQIVITSEPTDTAAHAAIGGEAGIVVKLEDQFGNVVNVPDSMHISLASGNSQATLLNNSGTTAVAGVATFTGLAINTAGSGYSLRIADLTDPALTIALTSTFAINPGAVSRLIYSVEPTNAMAGQPVGGSNGVSVDLLDAYQNVTSGTDEIEMSLANNPSATPPYGYLTYAVNGVAHFPALSVDMASTGYFLSAQDLGTVVPIAISTPFNITPGPAKTLAFVSNWGATVSGQPIAAPGGVQVAVEDTFGNVVNSSDPITVSLASGPNGSSLAGTLTQPASGGTATFGNLSIAEAGSNYALTAADPADGFTATSPGFTITPSTASRLVFTTQPTDTAAGLPIDSPLGVQVSVEDSQGNAVTTNESITIAFATDPTNTSLGGTLTEPTINGVASFPDLSITTIGAAYSLTASVSGSTAFGSTTSSLFNIVQAVPKKLAFSALPATEVAGAPVGGTRFQVMVEDGYGNIVNSNDSITVALAINPGGSTFNGSSLTISAVNGIATFSSATLNIASSGYVLSATDNTTAGISVGDSNAFSVIAGPASQLVFTSEPNNSIVGSSLNSTSGIQVTVEDRFGNQVSSTDPITVGLSSNPTSLSGAGVEYATNGRVSYGNVTVGVAGVGYTLIATDSANSISGVSTPFNVNSQPGFVDLNSVAYPTNLVSDGKGNLFGLSENGYGGVFELAGASHPLITLVSFTGQSGNYPGAYPTGNLAFDAQGNIYGVTREGGAGNYGTVFEISALTHSFTSLVSFTNEGGAYPGYEPESGVSIDGNGNIYGTTEFGGANSSASDFGTVFELSGSSHAFTSLVTFDNAADAPGAYPFWGLTIDNNGNVFGTTLDTVFEISAGSGTFKNLVPFNNGYDVYPNGELVVDVSGNLYGETSFGGADGEGTVFTISAASQSFATLFSFTGIGGTDPGEEPIGTLAIDGNGNLYGTAYGGNSALNDGSVFEFSAATNTFTILASFTGNGGAYPGQNPQSGVVLDSNGNLYGTTCYGGSQGDGTVFELSGPAHTTFTNLVSFTGYSGNYPGYYPYQEPVVDGSGNVYGTVGFYYENYQIGIYEITTARQLAVLTQPTTAAAGATLSPIQVAVQDGQGNTITTDTSQVTLTLTTGPAGSVLGGSTTAVAVNGVATFDNLRLTVAGTYTYVASDGGLRSATTGTITVTPGAAAKLAFVSSPGNSVAGSSIGTISVEMTDAYGNQVSGTDSIGLAFSANPGNATLITTPVTAVNGIAAFQNITVTSAAAGYQLSAADLTHTGYISAVSAQFNVSAGAAYSMSIIGGNSQKTTAGSAFGASLTVQVLDQFSNPVPGALITFSAPTVEAGLTVLNVSGTTNSQGEISAVAVANLIVGAFTVTASVQNSSLQSAFQLSNAAPVSLTGPAFYLELDPTDPNELDVYSNQTATGTATQRAVTTISSINVNGSGKVDPLTIDFSHGNPLSSIGLNYVGGGSSSSNELIFIGGSANDTISVSSNRIVFDGSSITYSNVGQVIFYPGTGTDSLSVTSGSLILGTPQGGAAMEYFSSIAVSAGASLSMMADSSAPNVLVTASLSLAGASGAWTSRLDLANNSLDITGGSFSTIFNQIQQGYNASAGGNWSGLGIVSSSAAADSTHRTAIGFLQNNEGGTPIFTAANQFDGVVPGFSDILLKYTYFGDANLDGRVDGSDYTRIDYGYLSRSTGWLNGDFNYDSKIDGSDYTLIDNAFNTQTVSLAATIDSVAASPVSPPPAATVMNPSNNTESASKAYATALFNSGAPVVFPLSQPRAGELIIDKKPQLPAADEDMIVIASSAARTDWPGATRSPASTLPTHHSHSPAGAKRDTGFQLKRWGVADRLELPSPGEDGQR